MDVKSVVFHEEEDPPVEFMAIWIILPCLWLCNKHGAAMEGDLYSCIYKESYYDKNAVL